MYFSFSGFFTTLYLSITTLFFLWSSFYFNSFTSVKNDSKSVILWFFNSLKTLGLKLKLIFYWDVLSSFNFIKSSDLHYLCLDLTHKTQSNLLFLHKESKHANSSFLFLCFLQIDLLIIIYLIKYEKLCLLYYLIKIFKRISIFCFFFLSSISSSITSTSIIPSFFSSTSILILLTIIIIIIVISSTSIIIIISITTFFIIVIFFIVFLQKLIDIFYKLFFEFRWHFLFKSIVTWIVFVTMIFFKS